MIELLKGRISDTEGLKEVLEIIATFKEVSTAVLNVDGEQLSGRIGIAWGKYITGALINDSEQQGKKALRKLLRMRAGKFVCFDLEDEKPIVELRQALGIDLVRTATVVPELDPKEAHFLWGMDEVLGSEEEEAADEDESELGDEKDNVYEGDGSDVAEEDLGIDEAPSVEAVPMEASFEPAMHDAEPILPNLEPIHTAVSGGDLSGDLPLPEVAEHEYKNIFELPKPAPQPEFTTSALDAVFGASPALENVAPFQESTLPTAFDAPDPWVELEKPAPIEDDWGVDTVEMKSAELAPEMPSWTRRPEPPPPDSDLSSTSPLSRKPMLQPNVVADEKFIGQRFVESPGSLRPSPATDSGRVGIAVFCVLLFVVSCAGTVILGPRAWEFITSVLHI